VGGAFADNLAFVASAAVDVVVCGAAVWCLS
jgi:hypothetical protein